MCHASPCQRHPAPYAFASPFGPGSHAFGTRWYRTCCVPLTHTLASSVFTSRMHVMSFVLRHRSESESKVRPASVLSHSTVMARQTKSESRVLAPAMTSPQRDKSAGLMTQQTKSESKIIKTLRGDDPADGSWSESESKVIKQCKATPGVWVLVRIRIQSHEGNSPLRWQAPTHA